MVPIVVFALTRHTPAGDWAAAILFGVASLTDWFDGYLARRQKSESMYGKLMDPLADKFLVVASLIMLQDLGRIHPYIVMLLICREIGITGLRALASAEGVVIAASSGGKWKTAIQMIAIPLLMIRTRPLGLPLYELGYVLLVISLGMSLWSAKDYIVGFFKGIAERQRLRKEKRMARKAAKREAKARRRAELEAQKPSASLKP